MRVAVLGSGSRGNSVLVASHDTRILVDAGLSGKEMASRLDRLGIAPEAVDGILVTHEHGDHTRGVGVFARRFGTPLYMTPGTRSACAALLRGKETVHSYTPGRPLTIGDLRIDPFLTVHDALDPVAVTVTGTKCGIRIGIATDLGRPTAGIRHSLARCDFLILEANHDEEMLRAGPYPASVQARISSSHGHLSNRAAATFACELAHPRLTGLFLAHLSGSCNRPELAHATVSRALAGAGWKGFLAVASQDAPTEFVDIPVLRSLRETDQLSLLP
ncbi:MAG: MBL fold metallo-hydrolase [Gemmatimonadota bacterium]